MERRILLIVLDGLGDRANPSLRYRTPLQVARTPNMDALASRGSCGLMDPIAPGVRAGSDTSHLAFLGYEPYEVYPGRGSFEALGMGMELKPGDVAFRCNFATVDENLVVKDRRAGRIKEGTAELARAVSGIEVDGIKFIVKEGVEHRAGLIMRGEGVSERVSDVDPHEEGVRVNKPRPLEPGAERAADALWEFLLRAHEILKEHPVNLEREERGLPPANFLLPRGPGRAPDLQPFGEKWDLKAAAIAGVPLIKGICRFLGMEVIEDPRFTGGVDTDMVAKFSTAVPLLERYDFVMVNIKATDIAGHDGNPEMKVKLIERADEAIGETLMDLSDVVLVITADHSTPCTVRDHSGDPVPIMIISEDVRRDECTAFDEISVARGTLRIRGTDLMPTLMNLSNRAEKFGA